MNEILNGLNMNDKKWNFTKALITKALEMDKCKIFAQDHSYIESSFEMTQEVKENVEETLKNIFVDENQELSINYVFYNFDATFTIIVYTEIDFIYFFEIHCDSKINVDTIKMFCEKTPNYNVAICTQSLGGQRKYYKNC